MINKKDYEYELPEDRIARFPKQERDSSKLLLYSHGAISEDVFSGLPAYLSPDNMLVFNNTRVIKARLIFRKSTGARIEVFCLQPLAPSSFDEALASLSFCSWQCTVGNAKRWKKDEVLSAEFEHEGKTHTLTAKHLELELNSTVNTRNVLFEWDAELAFSSVLELCGHIPIPPYLKREDKKSDNQRYQTIYSKLEGSVAAPTAGLHFTDKVIAALREKGVSMTEITLHVGAGTFMPMKTDDVAKHVMHREIFKVERRTLQELHDNIDGLIAVGTTSARMLESLYLLGINDTESKDITQWEAYKSEGEISARESLSRLMKRMDSANIEHFYASTQIMIVPGYRFKMIKGLITNFHQPESTLILLVAAFIGNDWKRVYDYALKHNFRFLSYGDSSFLKNTL
ncbi:MAG: tRNA preQ1(34) S-adenosylmethionine ribosyltransferase-isomerase QueA [Prevotellaceae bacterium]|jgi:S-adenosylmethionine:tRNA ribosyltransferase-isomerase|nr:tRNA preQ1(34) S-adenosylmethionine ribosyltransferase-isomerase QueA [Prevotellaceae bacterium]